MKKTHLLLLFCACQLSISSIAIAKQVSLCNAKLITAEKTLNQETPRINSSETAVQYNPATKEFVVESDRKSGEYPISSRYFKYKLKGRVQAQGDDHQIKLASLDVIAIEKGTGKTRGWESMAVDTIWMMNRVDDYFASLPNASFFPIGRDFQTKIVHDTVTNEELLPIIQNVMKDINSKNVIIKNSHPLFRTLTEKIDNQSHNGTQTMHFINAINKDYLTNHAIDKIEIIAKPDEAMGTTWYDLIFHIDNIFSDL